jgi:hypothetical protein
MLCIYLQFWVGKLFKCSCDYDIGEGSEGSQEGVASSTNIHQRIPINTAHAFLICYR